MSVAAEFVSDCSVVEAAEGLSDLDLTRCVADCAARERQSLAGLLGFLAEFDARDLHEPAGFDALYKYLMHHFGWSASSAFKRIQAARACRCFPELLPAIAAGDLNLSAVCALAPVLKAENLSRVLFEAARLPREELKVYVEDLRAEQAPEPGPQRPVTPFQLTLGAVIASESCGASDRTPIDPRWVPPPSPLERRAPELTSLNVKVDASFHALFARVRALCAHGPAGRDPARVLRRGLEMLLEAEEKRRFGAPRKVKRRAEVASSADAPAVVTVSQISTVPPEVTEAVVPDVVVAESGPRVSYEREHVLAAVRREVYDRDDGCCTFVGDDGHVCGSRYAVQLHHRIAWAHGGSNTPENLTLHCGPHNRLVGKRDGLGRRPPPRAPAEPRGPST
ncbi:MAG: HNH endonuclease [Myxococcales bacterium]|nr:HNH endonuclease [Myxococcales bacterium]